MSALLALSVMFWFIFALLLVWGISLISSGRGYNYWYRYWGVPMVIISPLPLFLAVLFSSGLR